MGIFDWFKRNRALQPEPEAIVAEPEPASQTPVLPSCDDLFVRFFDRWYTDDERRRHRRNGGVLPDVVRCAAPGTPVSDVSPLTRESGRRVIEFLNQLASVASGPADAPGRIDMAWIQGFDAFYDRKEIAKLLESADPGDRLNRYAMTCQAFAAILGEVLIASMPGCVWLPDAPTWESAVYDQRGGVRINVFDWSLKKLSAYGVNDGYAMKIKVCAKLYEDSWQSLEKR